MAVVGLVHADFLDARFCQCLLTTVTEDFGHILPAREKVLMTRAPAGMLHVARNVIGRGFLAHPLRPEYLVFVDSDIDWRPDQLWQLAETARGDGLPILSGLVCMQGGRDASLMRPLMYDYDFCEVQPTGGLQQVFCVGCGFLAIHRSALLQLYDTHREPTPWFNYEHRHGKAVSEDVVFAQRCWDAGIPIHVDGRIAVGHRKIHSFTMEPTTEMVAAS